MTSDSGLVTATSDGDTSDAEKQIDAIVYELYGLTAEEVKVVEKE